jgi:hypothetical protein
MASGLILSIVESPLQTSLYNKDPLALALGLRNNIPMNSTVRPYSNNSWIVEIENSAVRLGYIQQSNGAFTIIIDPDSSPLAGAREGPWLSKEDAMAEVADYLKGACRLGL